MKKLFAVFLSLVLISGCLFDNKDDGNKKGGGNLTYNISGKLNIDIGYKDAGSSISNTVSVGLPGINITLRGGKIAPQENVSDTRGEFNFSGIPNGIYTLSSDNADFTFEQESPTITVNNGNVSGLVFKLKGDQSKVNSLYNGICSGSVRDASGNAIDGVTLIISRLKSNYTFSLDNYKLTETQTGCFDSLSIPYGTYGVIPIKNGYVFEPENRIINVLAGQKITDIDFVGNLKSSCFSISGNCKDIYDEGVAGITLTISGNGIQPKTFITGSSGAFVFENMKPGSYVLVPAKDNYISNITSKTVDVTSSDISGQDFIVYPAGNVSRTISGKIKTSYGIGIVGISLTLTDSDSKSWTSISGIDGSFIFKGLSDGTYTINPAKDGYIFDPSSKTMTLSGVDLTDIDFTGTGSASGHYISGHVKTSAEGPLSGVILSIAETSGDNPRTAISASDGSFYFGGLEDNKVYTLTPSKENYIFDPETATVSIRGSDKAGIDFKGTIDTTVKNNNISGQIQGIAEDGISGVTVKLYVGDTLKNTHMTGSDGSFIFKNMEQGQYKLIPEKTGYVFLPSYKDITLSKASPGMNNLILKGYEDSATVRTIISGRIIDNNGNGASGIKIQMFANNNSTEKKDVAETDIQGYYRIDNLSNSSNLLYIIPVENYLFKNTVFSFPLNLGKNIDLDINCSLNYKLTGRIIDSDGNIIPDIKIYLNDGFTNEKNQTTSSSENQFSFTGIYAGKNVIKYSDIFYSFGSDSLIIDVTGTNTTLTVPDIVGIIPVNNQFYPLKSGISRTYIRSVKDLISGQTVESEYTETVSDSFIYNGNTYWLSKSDNGDTLNISRSDASFIYGNCCFGILAKTVPCLKDICDMAGEGVYKLFLKNTDEIATCKFWKTVDTNTGEDYEIFNEIVEDSGIKYEISIKIISCNYHLGSDPITVPTGRFFYTINSWYSITLNKITEQETTTYISKPFVNFAKNVGIISIFQWISENSINKKIITENLKSYNIPLE